jgi:DNA-binding transcriptional regulator YiaG
MATDEKEYARNYYLRNKLDLNTSKKSRYEKDAEYRAKAKERSKERWAQLRKNFHRELPDLARIEDETDHRNVRIVFRDKELIKLFSVTVLAKMIGVTTATIRNWHLRSVLPEATHKREEEKGVKRWYSSCYVNNVRTIYESFSGNVNVLAEKIKEQFVKNPDYELFLDVEVTEADKIAIKERMGV